MYFSVQSSRVSWVRSAMSKASSLNSNSNRSCSALLCERNSSMSLSRPHSRTMGAASLLRMRLNSLSSWFTSLALVVGSSFWALVMTRMPSLRAPMLFSKSPANSLQSAASTTLGGTLDTPAAIIFPATSWAIKRLPEPESPRIRQSMPIRVPFPWLALATMSFLSSSFRLFTMDFLAMSPFWGLSAARASPQKRQYLASARFSFPHFLQVIGYCISLALDASAASLLINWMVCASATPLCSKPLAFWKAFTAFWVAGP